MASDTLEGRAEGSNGIKKARKYIIDEFKNAGIKPFGGKYEYDFSFKVGVTRALSENIIAYIEGSDSLLKNEYIVVGAHYDHIGWNDVGKKKLCFNGADDNASGTASIIEIAKLLNANKSSLKRSIIIIGFGAEESGLIGSQHIFRDSIIAPSKIKCMFSFDMVGMYKINNGLELLGIETLKDYKTLINLAKQKAPIKIEKTTKNIENRTDTKSFGDEGIPSVQVFTGLNSLYHRYQDDSDKLDYEGMADIDKFMYELINIMASENTLAPSVAFKKQSEGKSSFYIAPYIRAGIGTSYNRYPDRFFNAKSVLSYNAGLAFKLSLSKNIAFQPEVVYESSGSQIEVTLSGKTHVSSYKSDRLSFPFHILIGGNNSSSENAYLMLGGYVKNSIKGVADREVVDYTRDYNKWQYGLSFGIGIELANFQMTIISQYGLSRLYSNPDMDDVRETASYVNFGFTF